MSRQEEAAKALEAAVEDLRVEIERCPDSEWHAVVPNGWTRAAVAMHCAMGNDVGTAWIAYFVSGRDILDDAEFHNRMNGRVADRTGQATKKEALAALARTTERARRYLLSLSDEELDQPARHGIAEREMTAGQFLANMGRHVRGHTEQFKAGL
ncbi:MAG TPA: DinB family protein [Candidatus Dormibacteraeota bacterium]|nr:DinB family protein [Candidatus Dormibacteraeota bacterium]